MSETNLDQLKQSIRRTQREFNLAYGSRFIETVVPDKKKQNSKKAARNKTTRQYLGDDKL